MISETLKLDSIDTQNPANPGYFGLWEIANVREITLGHVNVVAHCLCQSTLNAGSDAGEGRKFQLSVSSGPSTAPYQLMLTW